VWKIQSMMQPKKITSWLCTGTIWALLVLAVLPNTSWAGCACVCVEGDVQLVCDNPVEPRKKLCAPTWCAPPPDIREPEPLVANPGMEWLYASPPETELGADTYDWLEVGEEAGW
jgi:hypothetical protein